VAPDVVYVPVPRGQVGAVSRALAEPA